MRRLDGLDNLPRNLKRPWVTVGTFDGVHLGHQAVLGEVVSRARAGDGTAVVVTFRDPPRVLLAEEDPPLITSVPHRLLLLERLGIDVCLVLEFTPELAGTSAMDFVQQVLVRGLGTRGVVMGEEAVFGAGREGTAAFLQAHADAFAIEVLSVPAVTVDGERVSSTRIRAAITSGDFDAAARLLGRPFSVFGTVVKGDGRGRGLGFPTANLDLHHEIKPPDGVYIGEAVVGDDVLPALVSVGKQPTFAHAREGEPAASMVEIHLVDFAGQLYGRDVEARFLWRLRGQERFDSVDALVCAMERDLEAARAYFADAKS